METGNKFVRLRFSVAYAFDITLPNGMRLLEVLVDTTASSEVAGLYQDRLGKDYWINFKLIRDETSAEALEALLEDEW